MDAQNCRSLHWERGLKLLWSAVLVEAPSRSLHWERGLKLRVDGNLAAQTNRRSLHWERGLKHLRRLRVYLLRHVAPFTRSVD